MMSAAALWMKFSDDFVSRAKLDSEDLGRLEILWREALAELGFAVPRVPMFKLIQDEPFLNASALLESISDGALVLVSDAKTTFRATSARDSGLQVVRLAKTQWRLEKQLDVILRTCADPSQEKEKARRHSLALGICQQALMLRLPNPSPVFLARWLADVHAAPLRARSTIQRLLTIQKERNRLSAAWKGFFGREKREERNKNFAPDFLWISDLDQSITEARNEEFQTVLPVCLGCVEGRFWLVPEPYRETLIPPDDATIFVFRHARPESVPLLTKAKAVVFVNGGVLSHACSVARELGVPTVTRLSPDFWAVLEKNPNALLRVDATAGKVEIV